MKFTELYKKLEEIAPRELSAPWDNDGVMCHDPSRENVEKVLVALDPTAGAIEYARNGDFDVLVTHHPLIFKGLKSITGVDTVSFRAILALSGGVSVISLHTRLDAAKNGVNDALARAVGFEVSGVFGDNEAPTLGRLAELEGESLDVYNLAERVKTALGCESVRVTGKGSVHKIAFVGGDGKDFISPAMAAGADVLITGDTGYNASEAAAEQGFCVIEAGHFHSEFPVCSVVAEYIESLGIKTEVYRECPYKTI